MMKKTHKTGFQKKTFMDEQKYIILRNDTKFIDSTPSDFTTLLDEPLYLGTGFEVAITDIWYQTNYEVFFGNIQIEYILKESKNNTPDEEQLIYVDELIKKLEDTYKDINKQMKVYQSTFKTVESQNKSDIQEKIVKLISSDIEKIDLNRYIIEVKKFPHQNTINKTKIVSSNIENVLTLYENFLKGEDFRPNDKLIFNNHRDFLKSQQSKINKIVVTEPNINTDVLQPLALKEKDWFQTFKDSISQLREKLSDIIIKFFQLKENEIADLEIKCIEIENKMVEYFRYIRFKAKIDETLILNELQNVESDFSNVLKIDSSLSEVNSEIIYVLQHENLNRCFDKIKSLHKNVTEMIYPRTSQTLNRTKRETLRIDNEININDRITIEDFEDILEQKYSDFIKLEKKNHLEIRVNRDKYDILDVKFINFPQKTFLEYVDKIVLNVRKIQIIPNFYIYTDIISSQNVSETKLPLLKIVKVEGNNNDFIHKEYTQPQYLSLNKTVLNTIHIRILDHNNKLIKFNNSTLIIKLHIKKAK